ncbi:hypothetical protein TNCV_1621371 [Trichonephila clavipes]|nr:hypothetical protein TNCV_1621371 [Trichonephila clavipes]
MPTKWTRMLSEKYKALLVKLFFMNKESATVALRKFSLQKNVKTGKEPSAVVRLIKLVERFEETGSLENRVRSKRSSLRIIIKRCVQVYMASSVPRYDSRRLLNARILKFPDVLIPSI